MEWTDELIIQQTGQKIFQRLSLRRFLIASFIVFWLVLVLFFFKYTLTEFSRWRQFSESNQFFRLISFPPRGFIVDRHNSPLAQNSPSLDALIDYAVLPNDEKSKTKEFIVTNNLDFKISYERYLIIKNIQKEQIIAFKNILKQPDKVRVIESSTRLYPYQAALGNVLGYVGFPAEAEMKTSQVFDEEYVGKTGLEKTYQGYLRGVPGILKFEKNVEGDIRRSVEKSKLNQGHTLMTTIDAALQQKVYRLMDDYFRSQGYQKGTVIALKPNSGEIILMISYPNYDNNVFLQQAQDLRQILQNPTHPLFNRAVSGLYAPGSVIKPVVAAAALEENLIAPNKQIFSSGSLKIPNPYFPGKYSIFKDWKEHGWTNIYKAIADSVNVYFYTIGGGFGEQKGLGVYKLKEYFQKFGLGQKTGLDLVGEKNGFIPDPDTKKKTLDPIWRLGDTYNLSIGQGDLLVTPLQIAAFTAALSTNKIYQPYIVEKITAANGKAVWQHQPKILKEDIITANSLKIVQEGMRQTVTAGTGKSLNDLSIPLAGKSGTPEILAKRKLNAIFTGYAPYAKPEIVLTVLIEEVPVGSVATLPLYKEIMKAYFETKAPKLFPAAAPRHNVEETAGAPVE